MFRPCFSSQFPLPNHHNWLVMELIFPDDFIYTFPSVSARDLNGSGILGGNSLILNHHFGAQTPTRLTRCLVPTSAPKSLAWASREIRCHQCDLIMVALVKMLCWPRRLTLFLGGTFLFFQGRCFFSERWWWIQKSSSKKTAKLIT